MRSGGNIFDWLRSKRVGSGTTARKRLQLVLVHDRTGLPQGAMEAMKRDLLAVVSKYLVIDETTLRMEMRTDGEIVTFVSNVSVKEVARSGAV